MTDAATLAPETVTGRQGAGMALGILSVGQNLGMLIGPPIVGAVIEGANWGAGVVPIVAAVALGFAASFALKTGAHETGPTVRESI
ncbi:MAG: hypothetical protein M1482_05115 [Chloroflexi bacterium]|nr:hypothetical protein [Chloroflexota bacterium]